MLFCSFVLSAQEKQEKDVLQELVNTIENAPVYDLKKQQEINNLKERLEQVDPKDLWSRYEIYNGLLGEFKVFNQDSAFFYGLKAKTLAVQLDSMPLITSVVLDLAGITVSSGMYKETLDYLATIEPEEIPRNLRSLYYGLLGRVYSEMSEYSNLSSFSSEYKDLASKYRNLALKFTDEGTFFHSFLKEFITYKNGRVKDALKGFNSLLSQELSLREEALVHYLIGKIYEQIGNRDKAIVHFARASILDVKTSTKETLAIIHLAKLLFEKENLKMASLLIGKANRDATFYGAQHRKLQVGAILPLIEEKVITKIKQQREELYRRNVIVSVLLVLALCLVVVIYLQVRRLKKARKVILKTHKNLQKVNQQIRSVNMEVQEKNSELGRANYQLLEANKIKEESIGFFFAQDAQIFERYRKLKSSIEKDIGNDDLKRARYTLANMNLKREKEELLNNFDKTFINLFPNFIAEFNSLLKEDEQIELKKNQILNKELRIFALLRLGITHNEVIAQILGYSVNSIYVYKTKIRNKSWLDTKEFDQKLIENTTLKF